MDRKKLIPLTQIRVEKPCPKDWDGMTGDDKKRFCEHCQMHVHNLSAMTSREARELVSCAEGRLCVRFEKDGSGNIKTRPRFPALAMIAAALAGLVGMGCSEPLTGEAVKPPSPPVKQQPKKNVVVGDMPAPQSPKSDGELTGKVAIPPTKRSKNVVPPTLGIVVPRDMFEGDMPPTEPSKKNG